MYLSWSVIEYLLHSEWFEDQDLDIKHRIAQNIPKGEKALSLTSMSPMYSKKLINGDQLEWSLLAKPKKETNINQRCVGCHFEFTSPFV
jgi:hypothetical protein